MEVHRDASISRVSLEGRAVTNERADNRADNRANQAGKDSSLEIGRTEQGILFRVTGRGTMRESRLVARSAERYLESKGCTLTIDLSCCDYLDSTFLGCLVQLYKRFGPEAAQRYLVVAPEEKRERLLAPVHLDEVLPLADASPPLVGECQQIRLAEIDARELGTHVMQCHRRLAELAGPNQETFRHVADQLARELGVDG